MTPKFLGLNANSSKTVKATDFKFDRYFLMDKTDMTPQFFFFKKRHGQGQVTPNFWGQMPIAPKRLGATDFKFGMQLPSFYGQYGHDPQ